jgi:hypothetical protein
MAYQLGNIPADAPAWLVNELRKLQEAGQSAVDGVVYRTLYAAPSRIYDGLTVLADGASWNPGSGAGVYTYYAGSWKKLG